MNQHHKHRGQSTVEFALVAPLVITCAGLLLATTVTCLHYVALHDIARHAARSAITADDPIEAAQLAISDPDITLEVSENPTRTLVTVTAKRTGGLWWFGRFVPDGVLSQSVTMMRESPIVLG